MSDHQSRGKQRQTQNSPRGSQSPRRRRNSNLSRENCSISPERSARGDLDGINTDLYQHVVSLAKNAKFRDEVHKLANLWRNHSTIIRRFDGTVVQLHANKPRLVLFHVFDRGQSKNFHLWSLYWVDNTHNRDLRHHVISFDNAASNTLDLVKTDQIKGLKDRLLFANVECETAYLQLTGPESGVSCLKVSESELYTLDKKLSGRAGLIALDITSIDVSTLMGSVGYAKNDAIHVYVRKVASNPNVRGNRFMKVMIAILRKLSAIKISQDDKKLKFTTHELILLLHKWHQIVHREVNDLIAENPRTVTSRPGTPSGSDTGSNTSNSPRSDNGSGRRNNRRRFVPPKPADNKPAPVARGNGRYAKTL